jgi:eukaryotic-like serine/threonine-protein kinase
VIGETISHYQIQKKIGQGGMGIVYQAKDLKLGRLVALKFVPEPVRNNSRNLNQLVREARAASALNHPNICTVYEIDEHQGQAFIAMELLDGETLRSKIKSGPSTVEETLGIALQVLEGLEAVHANGLVHRDLKPENIFICRSGAVKLLDFGLAKIVRSDADPYADTMPIEMAGDAITENHVMIGTAPYMSPEQVRDEQLGPQADLFSLGAVLYEMLTGTRAFSGNSVGALLEAVLVQPPKKIRHLNANVPARLETAVEKLLHKDSARRYQTAAEAKADLEAMKASRGKPARSRRVPVVVGGVVLLIAAVYALSTFRVRDRVAPLSKIVLTQVTNQPGLELFPSLSPDGRTVIYASAAPGNWDIFLLRVSGKNAVNLTADSPADDTQPAFSPSGDLIAFRSERDGGGVYVMEATGESVRRLTNFGFNPSWSPDGRQLVIAEERVTDSPNERTRFSKLFIVDLATGSSRALPLDDGVQPNWSPHQHRIAYWAVKGGQRDLWVVRADGSDAQQVTNDASVDWNPVWDPSGDFLYFSSDRGGSMNLWRLPIDEKSGRVLGVPQAVTSGAGQRQHPSFSLNGRFIAYVETTATENIRRRAFDSKAGKLVGPEEILTQGNRMAKGPNPSPDGQWVTFYSWGKQEDIYIARSDGTGERYLTNDGYKDRIPRWSPDGKRIAFYSNRSGNFEIWVINPDGSGLKQITDDRAEANIRTVWSPDGRFIAGLHMSKGPFILELDAASNVVSRALLPPFPDPTCLFDPWTWSPDGKWLAGVRITPAGEYKGIARYSVADKRFEMLTDSGYAPTWLSTSRDLMFMNSDHGYVMNILSNKVEDLGELSELNVSPDNRFLYYTAVQSESDVWLIDLQKQ